MVLRKLKSFYGLIKTKWFYPKHICLKGKVYITGIPVYVFEYNGKVIMGNRVSLKSNRKSYHLNMHSPVKIMADKRDALIEIGDNTRINGTCIHAYKRISIGNNCLIAANCQIFDGNGHDLSFPDVHNRINTLGTAEEIIIEDDVWIGANSLITPGVKIGKGSVIAAGSVVVKDIPAMCVAAGNPAIVIKKYKE